MYSVYACTYEVLQGALHAWMLHNTVNRINNKTATELNDSAYDIAHYWHLLQEWRPWDDLIAVI